MFVFGQKTARYIAVATAYDTSHIMIHMCAMLQTKFTHLLGIIETIEIKR
jgi:hypothetical protein